ncbi:hypothetical protein [Xanthomonas oryzae pv. oryzae MAFF 311018]|nr:hypothetical protein [Xanthomonas oryzae pv. oryzae MAFF 311018]
MRSSFSQDPMAAWHWAGLAISAEVLQLKVGANQVTPCVAACLALLLSACLSTPAHATTSLSFEEGGYSILFEIGHEARPVIASLRFNAPDDNEGIWLQSDLQFKTFDTKRRIFRLIYTGGDPHVPPFTFVVLADKLPLMVNDKQINSSFSWEM